jgi:uncharacterized membrane protein (DUF4010 family)
MEQTSLFYRFGLALLLGVLVGLQREYAYADGRKKPDRLFAGDRTLALMGLTGCTGAYVADLLGSPWVLAVVVLVIGLWIFAYYYVSASQGSPGMTTEVAALLIVLAGALCYWDQLILAAALAVTTTVILSIKLETDRLVQHLTREDITAALKFAVITAIILPILPNQSLGPPPFDVLNPRTIWLMVVLISGISFLGYVLVKVVGSRRGIGLTGLLGGLASSTAVTLSFTQRSRDEAGLARPFALAIMVAWAVMFARILVVVAVLNRSLLSSLWPPLAATMAVALAYSAILYLSQRSDQDADVAFSNPFALGPAVKFAALYAVILLVARTAEIYLGETGVLASSVLAGLTDVDAITISMAQLSGPSGSLTLVTAALAVVLAAVANTLVKGGIVLTGGSAGLRRAILPGLILLLVTAIGVALLV